MNNFFIFNHDIFVDHLSKSITVLFCKDDVLDGKTAKSELEEYFQTSLLPDHFLIIAPSKCSPDLKKVFLNEFNEVFSGIPLYQKSISSKDISLYSFDKIGHLSATARGTLELSDALVSELKSIGLQKIFILRGGLVSAPGETHHYVFPSGKHCSSFLRTGNILLYSSEIYFIAFCLLEYFIDDQHFNIFCDTSSIIVIAVSLCELKNRFLEKPANVNISSFNSYNGLYQNESTYKNSDLLLVSASTSGNIVGYITEKHTLIKEQNIVILYFLSKKNDHHSIQSRILCNLAFDSVTNPNGLHPFETYKSNDCIYCKRESYAVEVSGDVFLLEKPRVKSHLLTVNDPEKNLSSFVSVFRNTPKSEPVLKVNYGEVNGDGKVHEIYVDFQRVIEGFANGNFSGFENKLNDYITQYVPSNLRYIIYVDDYSSKSLAEYIFRNIKANYSEDKIPELISIDELSLIENVLKSALIVSSCVSYGKKLLYVARALRNSDKLRLVYFVGITRLQNTKSLDFLTSNLRQGKYKSQTSTFVAIENLNCFRSSSKTSWHQEIENIETLLTFISSPKINKFSFTETISYLQRRIGVIGKSGDSSLRGLADGLFYESHIDIDEGRELKLRRNFAFFNFSNYYGEVSQSDVYFTISNVLNSKRNNSANDSTLSQSAFVRNLLSPLNFNRYNDGIIQASILRAALPVELSYIIDSDLSFEMYSILETMVKYRTNQQAEALTEFLYALAFKKLTLKREHLEAIINTLNVEPSDSLIFLFAKYIEVKTIPDLYHEKKADDERLEAF